MPQNSKRYDALAALETGRKRSKPNVSQRQIQIPKRNRGAGEHAQEVRLQWYDVDEGSGALETPSLWAVKAVGTGLLHIELCAPIEQQ